MLESGGVERGRRSLVAAILLVAAVALPSSARANPGYEPDPVQPSIELSATLPFGIAIDQTSQKIYVAEV